MSEPKSLHSKNRWYITMYLILNALTFLIVNSLQTFRGAEINFKDTSQWATTGPWALGLQLVTLVLCFLVPNEMKNILVFWRFRHSLPGCRAFSQYAHRDPRVDLTAMTRKLKNTPTDPDEQNRVWYGLYKKIENEIVILDAHRWYLLFRDLTGISFLLTPALAIPTLFLSPRFVALTYTIFLLAEYLSLSLAGRNAGKRFVCTVLARTSWK